MGTYCIRSFHWDGNDTPFAVLLPYCDGDQEDLDGTGFFDGARYSLGGDTAPKYTFEVMGANHNHFNTVYWSSELCNSPLASELFVSQ
jgi:hypothetical protein